MRRLSPAEITLRELGISDPEDIDIEEIAWHRKAKIKVRKLDGCEASIQGHNGQAIIMVDDRYGSARARFSIAHELGHWQHHRGKAFTCRPEDIGSSSRDASDPERVADVYAADLLLPEYLFKPAAGQFKRHSIDSIQKLATTFSTSLTATAIRLIEKGSEPAMLICHSQQNGRRWFKRSPAVPQRWFPRNELAPESKAMDVLYGQVSKSQQRSVRADAWFDGCDACRYEILEQSIKVPSNDGGGILTLLVFNDRRMLEEG